MCGIGGVYLPGTLKFNEIHQTILESIDKSLFERGPDANGFSKGDQYGFVHRRLSIIDLDPRSNQPMESQDWVLCYNGEIYNFQTIRTELEQFGVSFQTTSDTEVLLLSLQQWGIEETLKRCAGMFAFLAFYKPESTLYAVRDHMGIKPLLMSRLSDGALCFASSVSALVKAQPERNWQSYKPALASYFTLGAPFTKGSVFEGIERVEPAHYIKCTPDGLITKNRYWQPEYQDNFTIEDMLAVIQEYEISDVQSALFLSGGVDSTFLAAATNNLDCFHLTSPETKYAKEVAQKFNRKFICVKPELHDYEKNVSDVIEFHGEPLMSCGIPFSVSKEISNLGYKMAISANGADELFHGYPRTPMPEFVPDYLPLHEDKTRKWFSQQLSHIFRDKRNFAIDEFSNYIPSIIELGHDALSKYHLEGFSPSASHRWFELMSYVLHDLNPTLDAASMKNSLEVRVPFLDHRIVQGVLSWDANKLVTAKLGRKAPLKQYLGNFFPMSFFHRPKLGFSIHHDQLGSIANLGEKALKRAQQKNFIKINKSHEYGEYWRDMIYLGNSCYGYQVWKDCAITNVIN